MKCRKSLKNDSIFFDDPYLGRDWKETNNIHCVTNVNRFEWLLLLEMFENTFKNFQKILLASYPTNIQIDFLKSNS